MQTAEVPMSGRKGKRTRPFCQDWPSLLWLANFGCIEFIPWNRSVSWHATPTIL
jgi:DNA primase